METPFRAVNFAQHDIISRDKMDQIQADLYWVYDNTPRGRLFRPNGDILRDDLIVAIAGKKQINRNRKKSTAKASVKFGKAFAANCVPSVTTGVVADFQRNIFCVINGPKGKNLPDSTGFDISVAVQDDPTTKKEDVIKKDFWVHWSAFGFRMDDMNEF